MSICAFIFPLDRWNIPKLISTRRGIVSYCFCQTDSHWYVCCFCTTNLRKQCWRWYISSPFDTYVNVRIQTWLTEPSVQDPVNSIAAKNFCQRGEREKFVSKRREVLSMVESWRVAFVNYSVDLAAQSTRVLFQKVVVGDNLDSKYWLQYSCVAPPIVQYGSTVQSVVL